MSHRSSQRKTLPYGLTLLVSVILSCILMNVFTMSSQPDMFNSWTSLNSPAPGVNRIIDANFRQVWVETQDSRFFTAELFFNCEDKDMCWEWKEIENIPDMPEPYFPILRGNDCATLQKDTTPSNPNGQVLECVYTHFPGPEFGSKSFFALMADGNILYWHDGDSIIETQALFILSTFIIPFIVAVIVSVIYLMIHIMNRSSRENIDPIPKAG
jgi:hypothetical protein